MKPRTFVAVQFALWAFFFSSFIPFSGTILLPIVWLYDRRIFTGYLAIQLLDTIRYLPGAMNIVSGIPAVRHLPDVWLFMIPILSIPLIAGNIVFDTWIGAWSLKRKMKKLAPDLVLVCSWNPPSIARADPCGECFYYCETHSLWFCEEREQGISKGSLHRTVLVR